MPVPERELRERIEALTRSLPSLAPEHEHAIRTELGLGADQGDGDPLERLEARLLVLMAERENLLEDRRTSLRAWSWAGRMRLHWWRSSRLELAWQHPPWPLRLPRWYMRARPPRPAPRISIVTPSYNQAEFIERTVHSVVGQSYPELEYVVRDGGSTDGTVDVLRSHQHSLSWVSQPDRGQANAINLGFAGSSGEVMAYLNADDLLLPGSLACVARYLQAHPEVDAVYGHRVLIDPHDRQVGIWALPPHDDEMLVWGDYVPQETLFWRRRLWDRAGGAIDESFDFALDWDLLLRFRQAGARIVRLNRFLGAFRLHEAQKNVVLLRTGLEESDQLRNRCHGRDVSHQEAEMRLRGYRRRHVVRHTAWRLAARVPGWQLEWSPAPAEGQPR